MDIVATFALMVHVLLTVSCDDILEQSRHLTGSKRDESDGILSKYCATHFCFILFLSTRVLLQKQSNFDPK